MKASDVLKHVDHTLLKADSTWEQIQKICDESIKYKTASICIPPCYIKRIYDKYGDTVNIGTVIGFPLGYSITEAKVAEAKKAIEEGANEIDMVINITDARNGDFGKIEAEIRIIRNVCKNKILKVIIETCYLTKEEKIKLCKVITNAKADFIKTSTGFGTTGAIIEDIRLLKENIGPNVKIKAAGGMKTYDDLIAFLKEGAERLGTSSAIKIIEGMKSNSY
ncbi:MAG: deoxyribose-phosphate aldolase [Actinobacteria bacterium]|nr:deoxyribose-phosphate aldolase [Actinomycetota bacterium]